MQRPFGRKPRKVQMIDMKRNKVIRTFESVSEAGQFMNDSNARIYINNVCLGKQKSALGFYWKYAD